MFPTRRRGLLGLDKDEESDMDLMEGEDAKLHPTGASVELSTRSTSVPVAEDLGGDETDVEMDTEELIHKAPTPPLPPPRTSCPPPVALIVKPVTRRYTVISSRSPRRSPPRTETSAAPNTPAVASLVDLPASSPAAPSPPPPKLIRKRPVTPPLDHKQSDTTAAGKPIPISRKRKRGASPQPVAPVPPPKRAKARLSVTTTAPKYQIEAPPSSPLTPIKSSPVRGKRPQKEKDKADLPAQQPGRDLLGSLVQVLAFNSKSSVPLTELVDQVLENEPSLKEQHSLEQLKELSQAVLLRNKVFGRAEGKGIKVRRLDA